jgi:hypothetical protein
MIYCSVLRRWWIPAGWMAMVASCGDPFRADLFGAAVVGQACYLSEELSPGFGGLQLSETIVEEPSTDACGIGACVARDFQGRTDCPAGNLDGELCETRGGAPVVVPVPPQLPSRPAERQVICSCRCAGEPGAHPLCECPGGFACNLSAGGPSFCARRSGEFEGDEFVQPMEAP